ncbi:MAG TPA: hypothetical protein VLU24_10250 [Mycobacterium sp.]|nr:hypothetical protein [Mycobacterium sp.]
MSDATDIRAWARDKGLDIADHGRIPADVKAAYSAEHAGEPAFAVGAPAPATEGETAPKTAGETKPKTSRAARVVRRKARVSVERIAAGVWGFASNFVGGTNTPIGRALNLQAPVAGLVIEDAVKGTIVDKALQPLARAGERGEAVAALVGVPVVVGIMQTQPQLQQALYPLLKTLLESWLIITADKSSVLKARQKKLAEQLGEDVDIDAMIQLMFAPPASVPVPDEERIPA